MIATARNKPGFRWWVGVTLLLAGLLVGGVSAIRAVQAYRTARLIASGQIQVETLRGWMTLPYIAKVYGVPEDILREAIGAPTDGGDGLSLREWFSRLGVEPLAGRQRLEAALISQRAGFTDEPHE